ncbi:MAG: peptide-methionine (S)-S-oxide reductase MsrA, partial [Pirellulaceae bacterium]
MPACCKNSSWLLTVALLAAASCIGWLSLRNDAAVGQESTNQEGVSEVSDSDQTAVATFGGGCFWCVEAVFEELDGVSSVTSGYMGGAINNPTYKQICTGTTGHAEVCQIEYDPEQISFEKLLQVFFRTHDPT